MQTTEMGNLLDGVDDWDWEGDLDQASVMETIPAQVSRRVINTFKRVN